MPRNNFENQLDPDSVSAERMPFTKTPEYLIYYEDATGESHRFYLGQKNNDKEFAERVAACIARKRPSVAELQEMNLARLERFCED